MRTKKLLSEKTIHLIFEDTLLLKAGIALMELIGGILVYFVSQRFLLDVVSATTQDELMEDPHDLVSNYLLHAAQNFSISSQHFAAILLISHGVIKLPLIIGLLREKLWCYPITMVVFGCFVAYQLYQFNISNSMWLLALTLLDILVIGLTWHEYRYLRAHR